MEYTVTNENYDVNSNSSPYAGYGLIGIFLVLVLIVFYKQCIED